MRRNSRNRYAKSRRWIEPQDFRDLRRQSGLNRSEAAAELDVTPRTIQNWETGGARIPWMAYRMLRILRGYALPGHHWEGWTVRGRELIAPNGRAFDAVYLANISHVFAQARLWRQMYAASGRAKTAATVVDFPDQRRARPVPQGRGALPDGGKEIVTVTRINNVTVTQIQMKGGGK